MASQEVVKINVGESSSSIKPKIVVLPEEDRLSLYTVCIYRVSGNLLRANEAAYTPRLVSIGPLHHGQGHLQGMEAFKRRYLQNALTKFEVKNDELVEFAEQYELFVRQFYQETVNLDSKKFVEMILLDGIFIVQLFLKNRFSELRQGSDIIIFENRWMFRDLLHDMLLLENQLPFSIPEGLFDLVKQRPVLSELVGCGTDRELTFYNLAWEFFKDVGNTGKLLSTKEKVLGGRHFVEFLLNLHAPEPSRAGLNILAPKLPRERPTSPFELTRSAAELQQAGVRFSKRKGGCLFEIQFNTYTGMLTIPTLTVNDSTQTFFGNLIAFEQCGYYYTEKYITSYVILMDSLIRSPNDVDLLVDHGIIKMN